MLSRFPQRSAFLKAIAFAPLASRQSTRSLGQQLRVHRFQVSRTTPSWSRVQQAHAFSTTARWRDEQKPAAGTPAADAPGAPTSTSEEPKMAIAFTCTAGDCGHRQAHMFSKRAYEKGIVIIQCESCKNRHLIADHLGWFENLTDEGQHVTIEKLAKMQGQKVQRGSVDVNGVGADGVLEYSGDGDKPTSS